MLDWGGGKGVVVLCMLYWYGALGLDEKCMLVWYGALGLDEKCILVWNDGNDRGNAQGVKVCMLDWNDTYC